MTNATPTLVDPAHLVGVGDLARQYGITNQAVCNWAARYPDFPAAVCRPSGGALYLRPEVERWYATRHGWTTP